MQWCASNQFAYRKDLGTCDALLQVSHLLQSALDSGQKARIMQIDFSAAFDRVKNQSILYKLCLVGIGGSVEFLSTDHSTIWSMGFEVNWSTLCQECRSEVFLARYCSSCKILCFLPFWKISWSVRPMTPLWWLYCSIPRRYSYSSRVPDPWPRQGEWLEWPLGNEIDCE